MVDSYLKYVKEGIPTAFNSLREVMHLASYVSGQTAALPRIWWVPHSMHCKLQIGANQVSVDDLRKVAASLLISVEQQLRDLLADIPVTMQVSDFAPDDMNCATTGFNFLEAEANNPLKKVSQQLLNRLCAADAGRNRFISSFGDTQANTVWNTAELRKWLKQSANVMETLAVLMHVSGGQPARTTEHMTLTLRNTIFGLRSLFVSHDTVVAVSRFHKGQNITGRGKPIARFFPLSVARLLLQYFAIIRPVEQ